MTNPVAAVGIVWGKLEDHDPNEEPVMLGSCFLYHSDSWALTAAHCVPRNFRIYCEFPAFGEYLRAV
jgi:hypothetical protein